MLLSNFKESSESTCWRSRVSIRVISSSGHGKISGATRSATHRRVRACKSSDSCGMVGPEISARISSISMVSRVSLHTALFRNGSYIGSGEEPLWSRLLPYKARVATRVRMWAVLVWLPSIAGLLRDKDSPKPMLHLVSKRLEFADVTVDQLAFPCFRLSALCMVRRSTANQVTYNPLTRTPGQR